MKNASEFLAEMAGNENIPTTDDEKIRRMESAHDSTNAKAVGAAGQAADASPLSPPTLTLTAFLSLLGGELSSYSCCECGLHVAILD